jgi:hypothetical protein
MKTIVILLVRAYQRFLSPFLRPACRFVPTCSEYMIESIERKGVFLGIVKGLWRVIRCNPFLPGGYDPVD